jgi:hypothetical protein
MMHHTPLLKDQPVASNGCSIPSRYQTYIVDNSDQKGFHSGTKRFQNFDISETPGPGHYNQEDNTILKVREGKNEQIKKAHAQQARNRKNHTKNKSISEYQGTQESIRFQTPGPNNYNVAKPMSMRKDHHRANSSSFQSVRTNRSKFNTPGPNQYQPKRPQQQSISSCFKSTSQARAVLGQQKNQRVPSPTHYLIKSNLDDPRAPTSCFKSTTGRSEISYKTAKGAFYKDTKATSNSTPGPGSYGNISKWGKHKGDHGGSFMENQKRGHYLAISAPAIPLPPSKSLPGPGEYELVDYNGPRREARGSSMFSSNTDRWHRDRRYAYISKGLPGPADYNPKEESRKKQSFIFNYGRRFIN